VRARSREPGIVGQMALVSVVIPAFKPEYLQAAIISATEQTCEDIEILVGDDSVDARLEPIVTEIDDPRVTYHHHGFGDAELNLRKLWERATGEYIKPLFDDDLLLPASVESLVNALRSNPGSALAFHERVYVNSENDIVWTPPQLLEAGSMAALDHQFMVDHMLPTLSNFIGEPSNTMVSRELVDVTQVYTYRGRKLDFLADVASYLNLSTDAPIILVGGYLSAFRQHAAQSSHGTSPRISAGLYEWELFVRTEAVEGTLSGPELTSAWRSLRKMYAPHARHLPEIARLAAHLDDIVSNEPAQLLNDTFEADLAVAAKAVAARVAIAARQEPSPNHCAVCGQAIAEWLPHPAAVDLTFMDHMGVVGSRRDKHICPACHCNDRDRHLWLYIEAANLLADAPEMRILHIAPEAMLEPKIVALAPLEYVAGDLVPHHERHRRIDVEALEFDDDHFDLIICNHVLEHVDFPPRAIAEFYRCLAPGGHVIAQTPYSPILRRNLETTTSESEGFVTYYFGQDDHARLFGLDLIDDFHGAGFTGEPLEHTTLLGDLDPEAYGVNPVESFLLFSKPSG
jgi:methyltransferase family protein/glycosyl transferase family 2